MNSIYTGVWADELAVAGVKIGDDVGVQVD